NWVEVDGDGKYAKPVEDPANAYERRHGNGAGKLSRSAVATDDVSAMKEANTLTDVDAVSCPKCGGRMWDNRLTKRNPKAPDYKCRDRNCDGVVWPVKTTGSHSEPDASDSAEDSAAEVETPKAPARKSRAAKLALTDEIPF
ncbi:MAG TPA: hypothetical protein VN602_03470, partial [Gemmatimonadaceae bacterium]|nr:hypothetical protein [Gemmatimonadaceae bacterium]